MFSDLSRDLSFSFRTLAKNPGFTIAAILALALGIGANTTVFSVVEALLNFTLPIDDPNRVAFVFAENQSQDVDQSGVSVDDFLDWRGQSRSFEEFGAGTGTAYNFAGQGDPQRIAAFSVAAGFFRMTGLPLALGRSFRPEENERGNHHVAVLSHRFWQQQFGGQNDAVGEQILLDGLTYTVVGVAAPEFFFPNRDTVLWTPLLLEAGRAGRDERVLLAMGRLKEGVSAEMATAEMSSIARRIAEEHPETNEGWSAGVETLRENLRGGTALAVTLLYGSITFVLLIACANVANLLLARATSRSREIALRTTLGAGRLRVVRQLLTESVVLASAGGLIGLVAGIWGINFLRNMLAPDPNIGFLAEEMRLGGTIIVHTVGISVASGLIFGLFPALQISRANLNDTLKEGGRGGSSGKKRQALRSGLVIAEVAMALALLGSAGAFIRAFDHLYTGDPGFNPENLLTFRVALPESRYEDDRQRLAFYRSALMDLAALPGVREVATTTTLPLTVFPGAGGSRIRIQGLPEEDRNTVPDVIDLVVNSGYFETLEIPIIEGRSFQPSDSESSLRVGVVSRALVERYWPDSSPIGRQFQLPGGSEEDRPWITVIGVSENLETHAHSIRSPRPPAPHVFLPLSQNPRSSTFFAVRTGTAPTSLATQVRRTIWNVDPEQPLESVHTMREVIAQVDTQNTFFLRIMTGLAAVALLLAGVGIYGVMSYSVGQRSHEIGIRMALGARPGNILVLIVRQGAVLTLTGLLFGVAAAVGFVRLLATQLEGLALSGATGPLTFVAVSLVLLVVAEIASYLPARRAIRVDPLEALRCD